MEDAYYKTLQATTLVANLNNKFKTLSSMSCNTVVLVKMMLEDLH